MLGDAEIDKDGKGLRPDGKRACTLIPPAFGLAGVNLHTWTGFGSVTYWNAYVGATEMHGSGTFFDARLNNSQQYPVAAKSGAGNTRGTPDLLTSKLAALHFYQLAIPAPAPPGGSFDHSAAARGKVLFAGKAKCSGCHVPPRTGGSMINNAAFRHKVVADLGTPAGRLTAACHVSGLQLPCI